jgi:hypothetical protein
MTLVVRLTVRRSMADEFRSFERAAARIVIRHGGAVERQVTILDDPGGGDFREVHIVTFPDDQAYAAYRSDPEVLALRPLREACVVLHRSRRRPPGGHQLSRRAQGAHVPGRARGPQSA